MAKYDKLLNNLEINPDSDPENHRLLTRDECFVLAWLSFNQENRTLRKLMRDCKIRSVEECEEVVQNLVDLRILQSRRPSW